MKTIIFSCVVCLACQFSNEKKISEGHEIQLLNPSDGSHYKFVYRGAFSNSKRAKYPLGLSMQGKYLIVQKIITTDSMTVLVASEKRNLYDQVTIELERALKSKEIK